MLEFNTL